MVAVQKKNQTLINKIIYLESLLRNLRDCESLDEKLDILSGEERIQTFFPKAKLLQSLISEIDAEEKFAFKSLIAIGQGELVLSGFEQLENPIEKFGSLLAALLEIEKFYDGLGGIIGYQLAILRLLVEQEEGAKKEFDDIFYSQPHGFNLMERTAAVSAAVRRGIEALPRLGMVYPIGGAGDRLNLVDAETGEPLPAALLQFQGHTLLSILIRDLQAQEYLYYKLHNEQLATPVALMTSLEKNNHQHIMALCEEANWFGRPRDRFRFFIQGLVPVVSEEGDWLLKAPLELILKPGGHGVIWKSAEDNGIFEWLQELGRKKLIIKQINNPAAGTDDALLAFAGIGFSQDKDFGFATCRRLVKSPEGVVVFCRRKIDKFYDCSITNIEYTELAKKGLYDYPVEPGSLYSAYPANTNILFADVAQMQRYLKECSLPGMILNMKTHFKSLQKNGSYLDLQGGRLESTMQNIADVIVDRFEEDPKTNERVALKTFMTYNTRRKTLSVTKNSYQKGGALQGSPAGCFYEGLQNYYELLTDYCRMTLPDVPAEDLFADEGPSFLANLHPAIGPSWEIIAQKIRGGTLVFGSELHLDIAEIDLENIAIDGSFLVEAQNPLGHLDAGGIMHYSLNSGKCFMKNVVIQNKGIDRSADNDFWTPAIKRNEALRIILHGNAEFHAENVFFEGDRYIEVPDGCRITAYESEEGLIFEKQQISKPSWWWNYRYGKEEKIVLEHLLERLF